MSEGRFEKNGFILYRNGKRVEISNKYGVVAHGEVEVIDSGTIPEWFDEMALDKFIKDHCVVDFPRQDIIKKVHKGTQRYIQLQAVYQKQDGYWKIQEYDEYLTYIKEYMTLNKYHIDVEEYMRTNYELVEGITANVYKDGKGDCTNGGISSGRNSLIVICDNGPTEASDIRDCVYIDKQGIGRNEYIKAKPLYCPDRWYMAGGNFLYTSDSRFREITGISYPVSIHDRYEGR